MNKKPSPLQFSKEELEREAPAQPEVKASDKSKPRGKSPPTKSSSAPDGKGESPEKRQGTQQKTKRKNAHRLFFEENPNMDVPKVGRKKAVPLPLKAVTGSMHQAVDRHEEDNTGLEAAHSTQRSLSSTTRLVRNTRQNRKLKAQRGARTEGDAASIANSRPGRQGSKAMAAHQDQPTFASNPISRWQQRKAIQKQYRAAVRQGATQTAKAGATLMEKTRNKLSQGLGFLRKKKRSALLMGGLFAMLLLVMNSLSSCSVLLEGTLTSIASATYPSEDSDMKAAEAMYKQMETDLQYELDNYLLLHPEYDAVTIDSDKLEHDPYVLISMLTALKNAKPWTIDEVAGLLQTIFDRQYIRTESVTSETRYRTEWQTGIRYVQDPYTNQWVPEYYQYEASIPFQYRTVHVEIENFNLSHLPVYLMSRQQMGLYAMYMSQVGNRPDLFPGSPYPHKYLVAEYPEYEIPPEDLNDPTFAAIMEEAVKYLGFPYVWGGASPTTSFDCSGFVSWVLNQSGWNIGRLGSQGLYDHSIVLQPEEVRPGDLIFFTKTFEADNDVTHVGIMVNQNMMIHCGDPIQYTPIDDPYHIEHFYAFGRIPH